MEQTFGSYVREKRMARGLSLRGLAAKLEVSPVYMSNMENDRRPAPTKEKMDRLIEILGLCQADTELLLDLAAKSKTQRVSADLPEYIMERDIVRAALRTAKEVDATDEECVNAAKLANADSFIRRLPDGYDTMLYSDGSGFPRNRSSLS